MGNFQFFEGLRQDVANMISELGSKVLLKIPNIIHDAYGNEVNIEYDEVYEELWIRPVNEVMQIENVGQMNYEDIRFEVSYDTKLILDTIIIYQDQPYTVVSIDRPDTNEKTTHLVGYAKKRLS